MFSHLRNSHRAFRRLIGRTTRRAFALLMLVVLGASLLGSPSVASATIGCTNSALISAVQAGGTIDLPGGCTYSLDLVAGGPYLNMGINGLPAINKTVVINGNGATITRTGSTAFRLFYVGSGGNLTLHNVTLSNGLSQGGDGGYSAAASPSDYSLGGGGGGMGGNGGSSEGELGAGGGGSIGGNGGEGVQGAGGGGSLGGNGGVSDGGGGGGGAGMNADGGSAGSIGGNGGGTGGGSGGAFGTGDGGNGGNGTGSNGGGGGGGVGGNGTHSGNGGNGGTVPANSIGGGGGGACGSECVPISGGGNGGTVDPTSIGGGGGGGYGNGSGGHGGDGGLGSGGGGGGSGSDGIGGNGGFGGGGGGVEGHGGFGGGGGSAGLGGFGGGDDGGGGGGGFSGGGGAGLGGAIFVDGTGQLTIDSSTLSGNQALGGKGGGNMGQAPGARNYAGGGGGMGGAIFVNSGTVSVTNSTFAGNGAAGGQTAYSVSNGKGYGSAIFAEGGTVTLNNSTVSGNSASTSSALAQHDTGTITANSTLIANNVRGNCYGTIGGANNLEYGTTGQCGSGVTQTGDPKLGPLGNNGGLTDTFALTDTSSAAYQNGSCTVTVDQRGTTRKSPCDIGAYELPAALLPNLTINDVSQSEGNSGTTKFTFTVSLDAMAGPGGVTFDIATLDGTATWLSGDYTSKSLTSQIIPAGSTTYTFDVLVNGDTTVEPDETFIVHVTNITGAIGTDVYGQGTIVNDDSAPLPTLSISDVSQTEGNSGTTKFTFTVSLSAASASTVTFDIATADGTATIANNDYAANSLTGQTIPAGSTTYSFDVLVNGDTTVEPDETFSVNVTNVTGATVSKGTGTGTIQNDDSAPLPTLSISDVSQTEGNSGTTKFTFTVSLSAASASSVSFDIATADGTATIANNDYTANSLTGQTIPAGSTTYTFDVLVNGDTTVEPDETFSVNVTNVTGATVSKGTGTGTIQNDDSAPLPTLSISDVSQTEGNSGTTKFTFTVSLSAASASNVTFDIATADGTATIANNDYTANSLTGQTIPAGSTTTTFDVLVNGDTTVEPDETFSVNVTNVSGATVSKGTGTGTILNDDSAPLPALSISDVSQTEGNSGTTKFTFTVSLSAASASNVTFDIATADGTATIANNDYTANSLTGQTIPAGSTTTTFDVLVNGDTTVEPDETFSVNVTNVSGATVSKGTGTGTIQNDDSAPLPTLSISDVSQTEGNSGTTSFTFTVTLSAPAPSPVSFDIATADGTATTANNDYTAKSLTGQTIGAGQLTYGFAVAVNGDTTVEPDETFSVNVTNVSGATVSKGTGTGTIKNDDVAPPPVSLVPATLPGGKAGVAYSQTVHASGGIPAYTYVLGGTLPTGLNLSGATISGTPTATGSFPFSITANDSVAGGGVHSARVNYTIVISGPTITLSPAKLNTMKVGAAFSQTVTASGGDAPYSWSVSGTLPPGINLNTGTGEISGTPTATGQFSFTITAKDSTSGGTYSASVSYTEKIDPPTVLLNPASPLLDGTVGKTYTATFAASGGTAPYTYTESGALPNGVIFSGNAISGTPTAAGTFAFSIMAKDSTSGPGAPVSASRVYKLVIKPAP